MTDVTRYRFEDLCPTGETMVMGSDYDEALSQIAALREELANHDSASLLMNSWVTEHKTQMPWDKAIELIAVVTKMPDEEKQRLLCLDDQYELVSKRLAEAERRNSVLHEALQALINADSVTMDSAMDNAEAALKPKPEA